jgi:hypothetical protein
MFVHVTERTQLMLQAEAEKRAHQIFTGRKHSDEFPEDAWISIGPNWDLNLFLDKHDQPKAMLYRVRSDGTTDTAVGIPVI